MCSRGWALLWVVSMAVPVLASGPADRAAKAPISRDAANFITRTRWVGTYRSREGARRAELDRGVLRIGPGLVTWVIRVHREAGTSGPCEFLNNKKAWRAVYRLEGRRLRICAAIDWSHPRPHAFVVTAESDLLVLEPARGK